MISRVLTQIKSQERVAQEQIKNQKIEAVAQRESEEKQTIDQIEIQTMNLVASHFANLSENGEKGKIAERTVMVAANFLADKYERRSLEKMAKELISQRPNANAEAVLRISEAAEPAPENKNKSLWFTVLGSFNENNLEKAKKASKRFLAKIRKSDKSIEVHVYKTKFSNHYAIIVGREQSKKSADKLTNKARKLNWAKDAYSQSNRDWKLIF